ncbi:hypothetical protein ABZV31_26700 [Streptomyces sp. NPDC005202]
MSDMHTSSLSHTERLVGGTAVVELHGEIDILTAPPVSARIDALTSALP